MNRFVEPRKTRALVKIQDGCDHFCSYCIVPYLRKKLWSKPVSEVVKEISQYEKKGTKEVILTGINLISYQYDIAELLKEILEKTTIDRIRFGSIPVQAISLDLINLYRKEYRLCRVLSSTRLCRHFHIPLQSGSRGILKRMNRKYTPSEFTKLVAKIRRKIFGVTVTTDLIVGFPDETEKDFCDSLQLIKKLRFLKVHIFRFSKRKGTLAWKMIKNGEWLEVNPKIIKQRAKRAKKVSDLARKKEMKRFKNQKLAVLFEKEVKPGFYEGYSDNFIRVRKKSEKDLAGKVELSELGFA